MRFLMLGAGALGGYYGAMLVKGGADVAFLVRARRAAQIAERGLTVKFPDADEFRGPVKTISAGTVDGPYDVVLLACKGYDLDSAIADIAPAVGPESAVLPMLNGINQIDLLKDRFGTERVLGGMSIVRAELTVEGDIIHFPPPVPERTSFGELTGARSGRCMEIQRALAAGGVESTISEDIVAEMWEKFSGFVAVAAIASLTRGRAGEVAAAPAGARFVAAAIDECARVAAAEGHRFSAAMRELVRGLYARAGSPYGPSLLWDLENGRRTEGAHTIGDLVRRADSHGLDVPVLRAALCNLQIYEARRSAQA
jgi:2-dehydropantoate 2-reductase